MNVHELIKKMEELEKNIADIKKLLLEMTEKETRDFLTVEELRKKYRVGKNFCTGCAGIILWKTDT